MGINSVERERLEALDNLDLLDHLIHLQYEADDLFNKREMNSRNIERWQYYHNLYYQKMNEVIEVKYMIARRMNKVK